MIAFAINKDNIKVLEYKFLLSATKQLDISRENFDYLVNHQVNRTTLKFQSKRIVQFYKMVFLMGIDKT